METNNALQINRMPEVTRGQAPESTSKYCEEHYSEYVPAEKRDRRYYAAKYFMIFHKALKAYRNERPVSEENHRLFFKRMNYRRKFDKTFEA